jgi:Zn finger protein HypA/HybF involved in hydrogenase expression
MAQRPTKLEFHEHRVTCPYCRTDINVYSLMEVLIAARRICPKCKREILIDQGKAVKPSVESEKKPPKQVRPRVSKAQQG